MVKGTGQASRSVGSQVLGRADHACKHLGLKAGTLFPMPKAIAASEKCESALMLLAVLHELTVSRKTEQAAGTGMRCRF